MQSLFAFRDTAFVFSILLLMPAVAIRHVTMGKHSRLNSPQIVSVAKDLGVDIQSSFISPDVSLYKQTILSLQMRKERVAIGAEPALYFIPVSIGSPPQTFRVNLDTGSSTLAVFGDQCSDCGVHCNEHYNHTASETFSTISCSSTACCSSSSCKCAPSPFRSECGFGVQYGDGSGIAGPWSKDRVTIGDQTVQMNFGRISRVIANFEPFGVDGIIGFAFSNLNDNLSGKQYPTFMDSIGSQTDLPRVFSMCFGDNGGSMLIGGEDSAHVQGSVVYDDLVSNSGFWSLEISSIAVDGNVVSEQTISIIVDSGSTLWYVPETAYSNIKQELQNYCQSNQAAGCDRLQQLLDNPNRCAIFTNEELSLLPSISVTLPSETLNVPAISYLKSGLCGVEDYRVFAIVADSCGSADNPCIFGDAFMLPFAWVFDMDNGRIGHAIKQNCDTEIGSISDCVNIDPSAAPARFSVWTVWVVLTTVQFVRFMNKM